MAEITLYIRAAPSQWELPALGVPDIQLLVYLQLAGLEHTTEELRDSAESRTGRLPALEHGFDLPEPDDSCASDFDTARFLLRHLCNNVVNLDEELAADVEPDVLAWTSLIETQLEPVTIFTTWCEDQSYSKFTQKAYGYALPFPLSHFGPWRQRQLTQARFTNTSAAEVYDTAGKAYASLANHLQQLYPGNAAPISFFLGPDASTVDAALYPHLLYHLRSPASAPELRTQLTRYPILERYVDAVSRATNITSARAPPRPRARWQRSPEDSESRALSAEDKQRRRVTKWWLGGVVTVMCAYAVTFGNLPLGDGWSVEEEEDEDGM